MSIRQQMKKLSVLLTISEPEEESPGVFKTVLTHPQLQGELYFVHSKAIGRNETLKALDQNLIGQIVDLADIVGGLLDGKKQATAAATPAQPTHHPV